ncbi:MAG: hypothetical protein JSS43_20165 [Proteobacteria bacterium]|nr:hypothetical protein [Pseudomonadota bacterium]
MLIGVLSCRENRSHSGPIARIAGETIGATTRLPNMASEAFLACLSRSALENIARAEHVNLAPKAKHTRERIVARFKDGAYVWPGAGFRLTPEEWAEAFTPQIDADAEEPAAEGSDTDQAFEDDDQREAA